MSVLGRLPVGLLAVEKERRRLAKELHDEILPLIARLSRYVQSNCEPRFSSVPQILHNLIADMRDLLGELHPVDLEELGLVSALHTICNRYARKTGKCVLFVPIGAEEYIEPLTALCLYRAVQDVLLRFSHSQNDILVLACDLSNSPAISVRCVDKCVTSADWLTNPSCVGMISYRAWCDSIGAEVWTMSSSSTYCNSSDLDPQKGIDDTGTLNYPFDLTISITYLPADYASKTERDDLLMPSIVAEERKRISSEVSALIVSNFSSLKRGLNWVADANISAAVHEQLLEIDGRLKELLIGAYPELISQQPLAACIKQLALAFENSTGIFTTFELASDIGESKLSFDDKFALYRITQECLNNIEKHSSASHAKITLRSGSQDVTLLIEDDGKGFNGTASYNGRGLKNIAERASEINAVIAVSRANSYKTGTAVMITVQHPVAN